MLRPFISRPEIDHLLLLRGMYSLQDLSLQLVVRMFTQHSSLARNDITEWVTPGLFATQSGHLITILGHRRTMLVDPL